MDIISCQINWNLLKKNSKVSSRVLIHEWVPKVEAKGIQNLKLRIQQEVNYSDLLL